MPSHDELEHLTAGYVLNALDPEERDDFEGHLATCAVCAQRVAEIGVAREALALAAEDREPPPGLRARVLAAARAEKPGVRLRTAVAPSPAGLWGWLARFLARPMVSRMAALVAVVTVAALAGVTLWAVRLQDDVATTENRLAKSYQAIAIMAQAEEWWTAGGTEAAPAVTVSLAFAPEESAACLVVWNLPATEDGVYQAWTVEDGVATRVGALWPMDGALWIVIPGDVTGLDSVAVTLEESRGLSQPEGPVVAQVSIAR